MNFPGVLVVKLATSIGPDLHAVSSTKPAILHWCTTSTWASPKSSGTVLHCLYKTADPCHAVALCASKRQWPHLTTCGGEKAFSLCRNLRQFPLPKSLCVTWLGQHRTWTACSTFEKRQGRKSGNGWSWPVSPEAPHTGNAWRLCCSGSRGKASAASKCHHLAVPSKT